MTPDLPNNSHTFLGIYWNMNNAIWKYFLVTELCQALKDFRWSDYIPRRISNIYNQHNSREALKWSLFIYFSLLSFLKNWSPVCVFSRF